MANRDGTRPVGLGYTLQPHTHTSTHGSHPDKKQPPRTSLSRRHVCTQTLRCWTQLPTESRHGGVCPNLATGTCANTPESLHRHRSTHPQKHTGPCSLRTIPHTHPNEQAYRGPCRHTQANTYVHPQGGSHWGWPLCTRMATPASPPISPRAVHGGAPHPAHTHLTHPPHGKHGASGGPPRPPFRGRATVYDRARRAEPRGHEIGFERRREMRLQILSTGK